ncbi:MAG: hypothetical protein ACYC56_08450 [Candidatus Aquicultor sp.]
MIEKIKTTKSNVVLYFYNSRQKSQVRLIDKDTVESDDINDFELILKLELDTGPFAPLLASTPIYHYHEHRLKTDGSGFWSLCLNDQVHILSQLDPWNASMHVISTMANTNLNCYGVLKKDYKDRKNCSVFYKTQNNILTVFGLNGTSLFTTKRINEIKNTIRDFQIYLVYAPKNIDLKLEEDQWEVVAKEDWDGWNAWTKYKPNQTIIVEMIGDQIHITDTDIDQNKNDLIKKQYDLTAMESKTVQIQNEIIKTQNDTLQHVSDALKYTKTPQNNPPNTPDIQPTTPQEPTTDIPQKDQLDKVSVEDILRNVGYTEEEIEQII